MISRGPVAAIVLAVGSAAAVGTAASASRSLAVRGVIGHAQRATLRLPAGRSTRSFEISAVARHTYDVTISAPATASIVVTMRTPVGGRSVLDSLRGQGCRTSRGDAHCQLRFAEGGTPGGSWTVVAHKRSESPAVVRISVVFNRL